MAEILLIVGAALLLCRLFSSSSFLFLLAVGFVYLAFRWHYAWYWPVFFILGAIPLADTIKKHRRQ
jgi:hypothetical protein